MTVETERMEQIDEISLSEPTETVEPQQSAARVVSLDAAVQALLGPVKELLRRIEHRIDGAHTDATTPAAVDLSKVEQGIAELRGALQSVGKAVVARADEHLQGLARDLAEFRRDTTARLDKLAQTIPIPSPAVQAKPDVQEHHWERVLLGQELSQNPELSKVRQQLMDDIVAGKDAARSLAGQTMLFQSAPVDQIPELMRDVGEAYYQWSPRTSSSEEPLERALVSWLTKRAASAGLRNTIELVCPGDRFDAARHLAAERGVQVVTVHGWVVLRDNGKVFTKANVTVK